MGKEEIESVLGQEVSHVANGDMVTLALMQGVVNTFVIFLARVIGGLNDRALFRSDEDSRGPAYFVIVTELVLGVLASIVVMWFSRQRECQADRGGAKLAGTRNTIGALATPALKSLADAVVAANLAGTLSGPGPFTVYAPTNDAFKKIPPRVLSALTADVKLLTAVLTYHVTPGTAGAAQVEQRIRRTTRLCDHHSSHGGPQTRGADPEDRSAATLCDDRLRGGVNESTDVDARHANGARCGRGSGRRCGY